MLVVCEKWVGDGDRLLRNDPKFFSFWLGCSTMGHGGPKPSVWSRFSLRHLVPNWLQLRLELHSNWLELKPSVAPGYIIVWRPPASCGCTHLHRIQPRPQVKVIFRYLRLDAPASLFFCLFTQVHLLIDSSVEGQYVTLVDCQFLTYVFIKPSISFSCSWCLFIPGVLRMWRLM